MKRNIVFMVILVCVLGLVGCSNTKNDTNSAVGEENWDLIPMVMVDGVLYLDTGYNNKDIHECGNPDGEIISEVEGVPTVNNQSNFGTGYGYQYGETEGTIEIYMNDKWRIFATEEVRQQILFPNGKTDQNVIVKDSVTVARIKYYYGANIMEWTVEGEELDTLREWANGLKLEDGTVYEKGQSPSDCEGGEAWEIIPSDELSWAFSYIDNGSECYIVMDQRWYPVINPSKPPVEYSVRNTKIVDFDNAIPVDVSDSIIENCIEYAKSLGYEAGTMQKSVLIGSYYMDTVYFEDAVKREMIDEKDVVIFDSIRCVVDADTEIILGRIPYV